MRGNHWGRFFGITAFGESHGPAVGVVIEDIKPGIEFPFDEIRQALERRRPGKGEFVSSREEKDQFEVLSGLFEGKTTGMPICLVVYNRDARSEDYEILQELFRPGHADLSLYRKFKIFDYRGGGRVSGRETIARVAASPLVASIIEPAEIEIYPLSIGKIRIEDIDLEFLNSNELGWPCRKTFDSLLDYLADIRLKGDSVGGIVQVNIRKLPAGIGDPVFEKLDANISKGIMTIGGVKGIEFGAGFELGSMQGSEANDPLDSLSFSEEPTNSGGIYGGISSGDLLSFRFVVKPTPSISLPQKSVDRSGNHRTLKLSGRFDTCLVPRIIPVAEAMLKLVLADAISYQRLVENKQSDLTTLREAIDKVDEDILLSIFRRDKLIEQVAELKRSEKLETYQPEREREVFRNLIAKGAELGIDPELLRKIWEILLEHSRNRQ
jgi:chorismate synthase